MILQALIQYAVRSGLGDADFDRVGVRWLIQLGPNGKYLGVIPIYEDPSAKKPVPKRMLRPFTSANELAQGKTSHFLCDNLQRALGYDDPEKPSPEKTGRQHEYFQNLLRDALESLTEAKGDVEALLEFLKQDNSKQRAVQDILGHKAKPSDNVTFQIEGRLILDDPELKEFWRKRRGSKAGGTYESVCLATGKRSLVLSTHEKIRNIPGALGTGANLISFDKAAFCHFGLEQAQNAPLSAEAELKVRAALENLIEKSRAQRLVINDTIYLHWTRNPIELDPFDLLNTPDPEAIANLMTAAHKGSNVLGITPNDYYILGLSGNAARIIVRNWLATTVPMVQANIRRWFSDLAIIKTDGLTSQANFPLYLLLKAMVRAEIDELPPQLPADIIESILSGGPMPQAALAAALRRQSVDIKDRTNPNRMALIKACLLRSPTNSNNNMTESINLESKDPAYLCGRLLAIFDRLQYLALGGVNAGVVERFYASACSTPALVMGRLFRNAQFHLNKANGGAAENVRKEVEAVTTALGSQFPPTLTLEEQGRFALGFYHQKAEYRRRSAERREEEAQTAPN